MKCWYSISYASSGLYRLEKQQKQKTSEQQYSGEAKKQRSREAKKWRRRKAVLKCTSNKSREEKKSTGAGKQNSKKNAIPL